MPVGGASDDRIRLTRVHVAYHQRRPLPIQRTPTCAVTRQDYLIAEWRKLNLWKIKDLRIRRPPVVGLAY